MNRFLTSIFVVSLSVTAIGCGYSDEESQIKCDLERKANNGCFTDATYNQCLSCYESCGTDCAVAESCPVQYICSE